MRDRADNCVVVCSIENFDPMGVHTGDSITVAPAQTLSDVEYQAMRDAAFACIRRVGVETGGSNIQFAVEPDERRHGRHRDEPAREPLVGARVEGDRLPDREDRGSARGRLHARRDPERHHADDAGELRADHRLRRDEGAAVGVREAARHERRARHADAVGRRGHGHRPHVRRVAAEGLPVARDRAARAQRRSGRGRLRRHRRRRPRRAGRGAHARAAVPRRGRVASGRRRSSALAEATGIDPWFLDQIARITDERARLEALGFDGHGSPRVAAGEAPRVLRRPARLPVRRRPRGRCARRGWPTGVAVTFKTVDTCGAEFEASTPYHYAHVRGRGRGPAAPSGRRSSSSARDRTASGRASSSTTAACTRRSCCATPATRPSWSTATPRRCRPTTTRATASTSSRSRTRTCSTSSRPSSRSA